jgi:hypothetical protein
VGEGDRSPHVKTLHRLFGLEPTRRLQPLPFADAGAAWSRHDHHVTDDAIAIVQTAISAAALLDGLAGRRRRRAVETLDEVLRRTGLSLEELLEIIEADPGIEEFFVRGLQAAQDAADETKRRALTSAMVRGVQADLEVGTSVEVARFLMATLLQLDAVHLAVLRLLAGDDPLVVDRDSPRPWIRLMAREIVAAMPGIDPVLSQVISALQREGLIESGDDPLRKEQGFWIVRYGLLLLDFITDEVPSEPGAS